MTLEELTELTRDLGAMVREFVAVRFGEMSGRLKSLEDRISGIKDGAQGPVGPPGARGVDGLPGKAGRDGVDGAPGKDGSDGAQGPPGADGKDGAAGRDGVDGAHGDAGKNGRDGIDGKDGAPGAQGQKGDAGRDGTSITREQLIEAVAGMQGDWSAALHHYLKDEVEVVHGKDGIDGQDGAPGLQGPKGMDGRDGLPGVQGPAGLNGKDGTNGIDGKDGLGFDDFDVEHDGERTFTIKMARGERVKTWSFSIPIVLDRGVYQAGQTYEKGDGTTWGGSFWIAQEQTTSKPGEPGPGSKHWRLAVKKGGEGKPGPPGAIGERGPKGEKGDRGPQWS